MKTKLFTSIAALAFFAATLTLSSCQKEKVTKVTTKGSNPISARSQALAQQTIYDGITIAQTVASGGGIAFKNGSLNGLMGGCSKVTNDTTVSPHVVTIDFGSGCLSGDGNTRSGMIHIYYTSNAIRVPGTSFSVDFSSYVVDTNQISGVLTITNTGTNGSGNLTFGLTAPSIQIVLADGSGTITTAFNETGEWLAGEATTTTDDDVYGFAGSSTGTAADGTAMADNILSQLVKNLAPGCNPHFVKGQEVLQTAGNPDKTVDYGNGTCAAVATQTVSGVTTSYTFPKSYF